MFAANNKISGRQAARLLTFDLLGYSALVIPSVLSQTAGRDGIFSVFLGIGAGFLYLRLLKVMIEQTDVGFGDCLRKKCGRFAGNLLKAGYYFYFILLAGRVAEMFAELVVEELLEKQFRLILVILMVLVYYGVSGGIEGRARIYEILFWILLLPLFLMFLFALPAVDTDYWTPVFTEGIGDVLRGGYQVFLGIPALSVIPFLAGYIREKKQIYRCGTWALLFTGGILLVLYLILLGMFGMEGLKTLDYPVVTMMSRIQMTGGFLKRSDAFMFAIWFFTLYALLNSFVFAAGNLWKRKQEHVRWWLVFEIVLVLLLADSFYHWKELKFYYEIFFRYAGTPFVVIVPAGVTLLQKLERKKEPTGNENL